MRIFLYFLLITGSSLALPQYGGNVQVDNSQVEQISQKVEEIFQKEVVPDHPEHSELIEVIENHEHKIHEDGSEHPKTQDHQHSEHSELTGVIENHEHKVHEESSEYPKGQDLQHSEHSELTGGIENTDHKIHEKPLEHPKAHHPEHLEEPELLDHSKHTGHAKHSETSENIEHSEFTEDHKEKLKKYWWKVSGIFGGTDKDAPTDAEPGLGVGGPFTPHQSKFCEKGFDCVPWEICVDGYIALHGQEALEQRIKPVKPSNFETLKCGQEGNICCAIPEDILVAHQENVGPIDIIEDNIKPHQHSGHSASSKVDHGDGYDPTFPIETVEIKEDGTASSFVPSEPVEEIGEPSKPDQPVIIDTDVQTNKEGNYDISINVEIRPDHIETHTGETHESSIHKLPDLKSEVSSVGEDPASSVHGSSDIKGEIPSVLGPEHVHISSPVVEEEKVGPINARACGHLNQECVPYFQCVNGVINVDGTGLIDVRIKPQSVCTHPGFPNVPGVCCSKPGYEESTPSPILQCPDHQECVPLNLCSPERVTHTDGTGVLDLRTGHKKCVTTPGDEGVCCNRPPISIETCPEKSICVSKLECIGQAMNEANEFINYVGTGRWTHCSKYDDGVCCKQPERIVQDACPEKSICLPKEQCPGEALDNNGKFVDYVPGGSWSDCSVGNVNGICCILHKTIVVCPENSQCLSFDECDGKAMDKNEKFVDYPADGFWKVCSLGNSNGVCCIPSKPLILDTCPGNSKCLSPEQCTGQALDGSGKFVDYISSGSWSFCSIGNNNGVCCVPPVVLDACPEGSYCEVGNQCSGQALDDSNKFIDYVPSGSWSYCNLSPVSICCKSLPSRIVDTCPPQSACVRPDQCGGKALTEANNFVDFSVDGTWTQCSQYEGGICCQDIQTPKVPDYLQPAPLCGVRNYNIDERITSNKAANEAAFGEFPWQSIIFYQNLSFVCGASLVSNKFVVTAAHCVDGIQPYDIKIRFGEWIISSEDEVLPFVDRNVYKIHIHPEFNPKNVHKDLAVIEIEEPVEFQYHINSVCIPKQGYTMKPNTQCFATGWGKDSFEGSFQSTLKTIDLPFIDHERCENLLRKTRLGKYFRLDPSFNCAGGEENKDACDGDGGGPLVCKDKGTSQYQLIGITSWGIGCGQKDIPGVYANVPEYSNWIKDIIHIQSERVEALPPQYKEAVEPLVQEPVHQDQGHKIEELQQEKQQVHDVGILDIPEQVKQDHQQHQEEIESIPEQPVPGYGK